MFQHILDSCAFDREAKKVVLKTFYNRHHDANLHTDNSAYIGLSSQHDMLYQVKVNLRHGLVVDSHRAVEFPNFRIKPQN